MTSSAPPSASRLDALDPGRPALLPWSASAGLALFLGWIVLSGTRLPLALWPAGSAWYPPAALVATACILWGGRAVLPLLGGALVVALWHGHPQEALWRLLLVSAALKCAYWLGARVLRRLRFDPSFARPADVARFAAVMTFSGLLAAIVGVTDDVLVGTLSPGHAARSIEIFWVGDLVAVLGLAPLMLAAGKSLRERRMPQPGAALRSLQLPQILLALAVPAALVFAFGAAPRLGFLAYGVCFIPLGWIAINHGVAGAAAANAVIDVGAIALLHGSGALPGENLELQTFIASLALTGLLLGSVAEQRERARRLLAESEERYRDLVELMPDPLLVHREGRILFANAAAAKALGAGTPARLTGVELPDLASSESRVAVRERIARLAAGEPVDLVEHRLTRLDGSGTVDVESVSIPLAYEGGHAALTVARDITVRRRLAEELRHAQRLEAVGRLAGGVAHDFNNLLSVIVSYSELMLSRLPEPSQMREFVQETLAAAQRATALTRQLLTFSRKQVVEAKPVRLEEVVAGTEKLLRRLIGSHITLHFGCGRAGVVLADPGQLEQVVVNLVLNARDALPNGGEVWVETGAVTFRDSDPRFPGLGAGDYARLCVRDSGVGMSEEVRMHIFDPFFTTKEPGKGTGLGLATVHGIVAQAHGSIFVESAPGAGSRFSVFLPRAMKTGEHPKAQGAQPAAKPGMDGVRVLLVEDDDAVRAATRRLLESLGFAVVEAINGLAAISRLDSGADVDLVLSDISMPEMDGRRLAETLRELRPELPVLLVSGFADPDAQDGGGRRVLQKPLEATVLTAAIADALRKRG